MDIYAAVQSLIAQAIALELIKHDDQIYARNQILSLIGLDDFPSEGARDHIEEIPELLEIIIEFAAANGVIKDLAFEKEILSAKIMNVLVPKPSEVNEQFFTRYKNDPSSATDYFYRLSQFSNYIQTKNIAKNINYSAETSYGTLEITINLSKPEKDPKQIALELEMKGKASDYPKCLLCIENEGYAGRINHPARSTHRLIRLQLTGEPWFFQYSPYLYYNEHSIVLSGRHRDMKIDKNAFRRLLEFVDIFPHYFIGSNADLPIVGGSILTHDHYQAGRHEFAMARAVEEFSFTLSAYPEIKAAVIKWPLSVIRLKGADRESIANASEMILEKWRNYTDVNADIIAYTGETRHNTITPIVRKRGKEFEIDLVLRNNRTTEEHPLGIFHPHKEVHHIKKENIGLIEVMGLAVLPARLATELKEIEGFLLDDTVKVQEYHLPWALELKEKYGREINTCTVKEIVRKEVGLKFLKALEDAGVFKCSEEGFTAFRRFTGIL